MLTRKDDGMHATVPGMPECHAKSKTRNSVPSLVRNNVLEMLRKSEIVEIEIPDDDVKGETDWRSYGYGAFRDDPGWGDLFDEIERNRDLSITEDERR